MELSQFLKYDNIIIQCHNNPDADALASGLGILDYLKSNGKNAAFIYGGSFAVAKSNLRLMIQELDIDINYANTQDDLSVYLNIPLDEIPELLITVDCQYGAGNIQRFEAKEIATIDHHQVAYSLPELNDVRPSQASCATIVWDLLMKEGFDVNKDVNLATALYYGLMTDSANFTELYHPLDSDMRDYLNYSNPAIIKFKNTNISQDELRIAGIALLGAEYYKENRYAIVKSDPCDPNILGIISDMLLEVDNIDCCLVYSILDDGVKLSVRSCVKEIKANELAQFVCEGVGDGGGHLVKAGGYVQRLMLERQELDYDTGAIQAFFRERMADYFADNEIIYADSCELNTQEMERYEKLENQMGFVKGTDIVKKGTIATLRTMGGDMDILIEDDTYIILGIDGEIHPTTRKNFKEGYKISNAPYVYPGEYAPTVKSFMDGRTIEILPLVESCISTSVRKVMARELSHRTKVFSKWDDEKYYLGKPGDYLIVSEDDLNDVYVMKRDIFMKTFKKV